jgi:hypothetical protein
MYNKGVRIKGDVMTKYVFMKLMGLTLVIVGFSYCLTSFSNFYAYLYGDIQIANGNIYLMTTGLIFPLYMFIFGVFFYFYTDKLPEKINYFILVSGIILCIGGILRLFIGSGLMQFIHLSFAFVLLIFGGLIIFGCYKFKY